MKLNITADEYEIKELHKIISLKVKRFRKEKKLSQLEVANLMGFDSPTFYSNAEANRENKHFSIEHIYLISKILNVPMQDLLPIGDELSRINFKNSNKILKK